MEYALEQVLLVIAIWALFRKWYTAFLVLGGLVFLWPAVRERRLMARWREDSSRGSQSEALMRRNRIVIRIKVWLGVAMWAGAAYSAFPGLALGANSLAILMGVVLSTLGLTVLFTAGRLASYVPRGVLWGNGLVLRLCALVVLLMGGVLLVTFGWK